MTIQEQRAKDRKEKLKKFDDWQKVKKEKEEVSRWTCRNPFDNTFRTQNTFMNRPNLRRHNQSMNYERYVYINEVIRIFSASETSTDAIQSAGGAETLESKSAAAAGRRR